MKRISLIILIYLLSGIFPDTVGFVLITEQKHIFIQSLMSPRSINIIFIFVFLLPRNPCQKIIVFSLNFILFLCIYFLTQMKSTTVLYRYNDISRKNGFYSLNIRHAAITGAIYTLVSTNKRIVIGFYSSKDLNRNRRTYTRILCFMAENTTV